MRSWRAMAAMMRSTADAHVREQHRIVQVLEARVQEAPRPLRVGEPALTQQPRDRRVDVQGGGERRRGGFVARLAFPSAGRSWPSGVDLGLLQSACYVCTHRGHEGHKGQSTDA